MDKLSTIKTLKDMITNQGAACYRSNEYLQRRIESINQLAVDLIEKLTEEE